MAKTSSNPMKKDTIAPDFTLPDVISEKPVSLSEIQSEVATVILFICNHCPFVVHIIDGIVSLAKTYQAKGIAFVAVSSNDVVNYPEDAPDQMAAFAKQYGVTFPYLYDESQAVAKAYDAACTPDIYVFDSNLRSVYHGQFDASRPSNDTPVTGADLAAALDALLTGTPVSGNQKPSIGCNIKWKA